MIPFTKTSTPKMRSFFLLTVSLLLAVTTSAFRYPRDFVLQVTNYPNVVTQPSSCVPVRGSASTQKTLVCDPKKILNLEQVNTLNRMLIDIQEKLNSDRNACDRNYPRPTIAIAIIDRMQLGMNEVSDVNVIDYAAIFSYYLFESWKLPTQCSSEVDKLIIFYSKEDGVVYTYAGENLKLKMPQRTIVNTAIESKAAFGSGVYEGLKYLVQRYHEILGLNKGGMFGTR